MPANMMSEVGLAHDKSTREAFTETERTLVSTTTVANLKRPELKLGVTMSGKFQEFCTQIPRVLYPSLQKLGERPRERERERE